MSFLDDFEKELCKIFSNKKDIDFESPQSKLEILMILEQLEEAYPVEKMSEDDIIENLLLRSKTSYEHLL